MTENLSHLNLEGHLVSAGKEPNHGGVISEFDDGVRVVDGDAFCGLWSVCEKVLYPSTRTEMTRILT